MRIGRGSQSERSEHRHRTTVKTLLPGHPERHQRRDKLARSAAVGVGTAGWWVARRHAERTARGREPVAYWGGGTGSSVTGVMIEVDTILTPS
jgi:hypothetical protein